MKTIRTEQAVGLPLSHDITRIDYGKTKEVCFKKGHIVVQEDIPILLSLGKKICLFPWIQQKYMKKRQQHFCITC